jgi:hypothetical protein
MATTATLVNMSRRRAAANGAPGGSAGPFTQRLRLAIHVDLRGAVGCGSVPDAFLAGGDDCVVCVVCVLMTNHL